MITVTVAAMTATQNLEQATLANCERTADAAHYAAEMRENGMDQEHTADAVRAMFSDVQEPALTIMVEHIHKVNDSPDEIRRKVSRQCFALSVEA